MATILKVLGQSNPVATTPTTLYTVPSSTSTVCSSLVVCNRSSVETRFRIAIVPSGETLGSKNYLYYDVILAGNDTFVATIGMSLATGDSVSIYTNDATLSFNLFGQENI